MFPAQQSPGLGRVEETGVAVEIALDRNCRKVPCGKLTAIGIERGIGGADIKNLMAGEVGENPRKGCPRRCLRRNIGPQMFRNRPVGGIIGRSGKRPRLDPVITQAGNADPRIGAGKAIGLLFATRAYSNSGTGVLLVFGFTGLMGFSLGPTMNHYLSLPNGSEIVGTALLATGAAFLGLSTYVQVTKKDFEFLGGFLMVALIGLIVVSLVGMFFSTPGLSLLLAYASVLIFGAYILYDTSSIIAGRQTNYIMATLSLYLDILNMFMAMLRIVSGGRN